MTMSVKLLGIICTCLASICSVSCTRNSVKESHGFTKNEASVICNNEAYSYDEYVNFVYYCFHELNKDHATKTDELVLLISKYMHNKRIDLQKVNAIIANENGYNIYYTYPLSSWENDLHFGSFHELLIQDGIIYSDIFIAVMDPVYE